MNAVVCHQASYTDLVYLGPIGSALITKVISNMLCMLNAIGMAEAMMIGEASTNQSQSLSRVQS